MTPTYVILGINFYSNDLRQQRVRVLAKKMDEVHSIGIQQNWTQKQYREGLERIMIETRQKLKNGEIQLNKNTRESLGLKMKGKQ